MPPKLRKDKPTQGSKSPSTNMFDALSEDLHKKPPAKTSTSDVGTMSTTPQPPSETQLTTMQNDIASMAQVIMNLSNSIHKMDKLDRIDIIESRQKSSETKITEMVSNLRSELEQLKTTSKDTTSVHTPSYAEALLKTTEKSNKNNTTHADTTPMENLRSTSTPHSTDASTASAEKRFDSITNGLDESTNTDEPQTDMMKPTYDTMTQTHQEKRSKNKPMFVTNAHNAPDMTNTTSYHTYGHRSNNSQVPTTLPMNTSHETESNDENMSQTTQTLPTTTHKYWKIAASETHQPHRFLQYMENIKLMGDSISHLRQFYERIRLAFHSSFMKAVDILPPFKEISSQYPFGHILVPHNEYYIGYHSIVNTYNWFSTALYTGLTDMKMISPRMCPLASRVITTDKTATDGWMLLYFLLCSRNPLLGGKGEDVIMEITTLRINQNDDIHSFYERVVDLQEKLEYSTEVISKTKLLDKYLQAMSKSMPHHHLLQYFIVDLNMHIAHQGHNKYHPTMTIHTIYQHLLSTNAPINFQTKQIKKFKPNISQLTSNQIPTDTISTTKFDDAKIDTNHTDTDDEMGTFILHDDSDEKHFIQYDATIQAFRHHSQNRPKIICEACGLTGHHASKCYRR